MFGLPDDWGVGRSYNNDLPPQDSTKRAERHNLVTFLQECLQNFNNFFMLLLITFIHRSTEAVKSTQKHTKKRRDSHGGRKPFIWPVNINMRWTNKFFRGVNYSKKTCTNFSILRRFYKFFPNFSHIFSDFLPIFYRFFSISFQYFYDNCTDFFSSELPLEVFDAFLITSFHFGEILYAIIFAANTTILIFELRPCCFLKFRLAFQWKTQS